MRREIVQRAEEVDESAAKSNGLELVNQEESNIRYRVVFETREAGPGSFPRRGTTGTPRRTAEGRCDGPEKPTILRWYRGPVSSHTSRLHASISVSPTSTVPPGSDHSLCADMRCFTSRMRSFLQENTGNPDLERGVFPHDTSGSRPTAMIIEISNVFIKGNADARIRWAHFLQPQMPPSC